MIARAPRGSNRTAEAFETAGDRVFLDANVLFSAAYRGDSGLARLWRPTYRITLLSSRYAIEEARRNLDDVHARERLARLVTGLEVVTEVATGNLPNGVSLPEKDWPILLAAIAAEASHLLTGDRAHFGDYFGRRIAGILIQRPGDYLASLA